MPDYTNISWADFFSHIYIEKEALEYELTEQILAMYPDAVRIHIEHYKDIFNRPHQDCEIQKKAPSLVLAVKHGELIYPGARVCQNFDNHYFYYTSSIMNCPFDCRYCYLKGMYPSSCIVVFVNIDDIFAEAARLCEKHPVYLCVSYDTDILAMEHLTGFASKWCDFTSAHDNITIEIRTKSAFDCTMLSKYANSGIIMAWTLSPDPVIDMYELHTPSLNARLSAIRKAYECGFTVRLCFDPMIYIKDWENIYKNFYEEVFRNIDAGQIYDASYGLFRISASYIKNMRRRHPDSISTYPYSNINGICSYDPGLSKRMNNLAFSCLSQYIPSDKIYKPEW